MADEPIRVREGRYGKAGNKGVCVFIDDRASWKISTDPETGDMTITIPADSRWRVATDLFTETDPAKNPTGLAPGRPLTALFFEGGRLNAQDDRVIVFTHDHSDT